MTDGSKFSYIICIVHKGGYKMSRHIVIDGNAFYEVDDECMQVKKADGINRENKEKDKAEKMSKKEDLKK